MTTTKSEQSERLRSILAGRIVVDEIAGEHNHGLPEYFVADCPACQYRERATAELDGVQELSVDLVGRCVDHLGTTVAQLLVEAGRPEWATDLDSNDVGGADEFVRWSAELARIPGSFEPSDLIRNCELTITALQYGAEQGDVQAGVPVLEVATVRPGEGFQLGTLALSLDDARRLAAALTAAVHRMEAWR